MNCDTTQETDGGVITILIYIIIFPLSLLPFPALYAISDLLYVIVYHFAGYRKRVVFENLRSAFPEKSEEEINRVARGFYHHFCDLILESIKAFTLSRKAALARYHDSNPELLTPWFKQGRNIIALAGHYGNWEWSGLATPLSTPFTLCAVYQSLSNIAVDKLIQHSRGRTGTVLVPTTTVGSFLETGKAQPFMLGLISDQSPRGDSRKYWLKFLGRETACSTGLEYFSRKYDMPLFFFSVEKIKRGFYRTEWILISDKPRECSEGELNARFMKLLEEKIKARPELWLWSHRRWKLTRPQPQLKPSQDSQLL